MSNTLEIPKHSGAKRRRARKISFGNRFVQFSPPVEWFAQVKAIAAKDLDRDGGSGHYGVFVADDGNQYFERWRASRDYIWTYSAAEDRAAKAKKAA